MIVHRAHRTFLILSIVAVFHAADVRAADVISTYSGPSANWTTAAWLDVPPVGGYPDNGNAGVATYDAVFSGGGTLTLDQNITIQMFTLSGTVTGSFNLTTNDLLHDSGGTLSGTGINNANGGMQIDGYQNFVDTRTINVAGSSSFTGYAPFSNGYLYLSNGATLNNSGTFDAGWATNFSNNIAPNGSAGIFNNSGTFTRSIGTGTTTISVPFNNSNVVTVQAGTLTLNGGGAESGSFQVASGTTLNFNGPVTTLAAGTTLYGPGTTIISGTASVTGPAVTYSGGGLLQVSGTLTGAGTLTASAPVELYGGTMSGAGITNINSDLTIDGYQNFVDTRTINVAGSSSFTGYAPYSIGYLYLSNGATLNNSGTFDAGWSTNLNNTIIPNGPVGTFNNSGTFTRSVGTGTTTVSVPFNNSHIVTVQAGTLVLSGGGTETGSFQVASGATLSIGGSGITLAAGSSLSGPGTIVIPSSQTVTVIAPALTFGGGGSLQVIGTLDGAGTLTATAPVEWSGGTMSGGGITNTNGGLSIDGYQNRLDTRTLNNGGSASFTGVAIDQVGYFYLYNGAILNNSGTFDSGWATNFNNNIIPNGSVGTFNNSGTFTRSVGTGTTTVSVPFNNSHIVTVQAGTLVLSGGGTETGSFQVASGATLNIGGSGITLAAGSSLSGPGTIVIPSSQTVTVTAPALTFGGSGLLQMTGTLTGGGALIATAPVEWTGGTISVDATTNGGLQIDGYQVFLDGHGFTNGGSATFTGDAASQVGYLYLTNGSKFVNSGTLDTGWAANFNNNISPLGTSGAFYNTGTFTRSVGSGITAVAVPFANYGIVDVKAGTLEFDSSLSIGNNSSLKVSGGKLRINVTGAASVGSGATALISGTGTLELASSVSALGVTSPVADRVAISNTSMAAAGLLISAGNQQVGAISGSGNVQVNAGARLTADAIIAGALMIGGASGNPAKVTIAASDENGEPLGEGLASGAGGGLEAAGFAGHSTNLGGLPGDSLLFASGTPFERSASDAAPPSSVALFRDAVPEPSSIALTLAGIFALSSLALCRRSFRRRNQGFSETSWCLRHSLMSLSFTNSAKRLNYWGCRPAKRYNVDWHIEGASLRISRTDHFFSEGSS